MDPVLRSQICVNQYNTPRRIGSVNFTYPYASVHTARHQVDIVELQSGDGAGMANQATMHLSTSQIPQAHHTIGGTASQGSFKNLESTNKVGRPIS